MKYKHGKCNTREYRSWLELRRRCNSKNRPSYKDYGGRGITYTKSWDSFNQFLSDMGLCPDGNYSLDRIDVNGNYCKENCRWADQSTQSYNTRLKKTNKSGIPGVCLVNSRGKLYWNASYTLTGKNYVLYYGKDFFLACCARKSWENTHEFFRNKETVSSQKPS